VDDPILGLGLAAELVLSERHFSRTPVCTLRMAESSSLASAAAFSRSYCSKIFLACAVVMARAAAGGDCGAASSLEEVSVDVQLGNNASKIIRAVALSRAVGRVTVCCLPVHP
jgi:hypothetical protein